MKVPEPSSLQQSQGRGSGCYQKPVNSDSGLGGTGGNLRGHLEFHGTALCAVTGISLLSFQQSESPFLFVAHLLIGKKSPK